MNPICPNCKSRNVDETEERNKIKTSCYNCGITTTTEMHTIEIAPMLSADVIKQKIEIFNRTNSMLN